MTFPFSTGIIIERGKDEFDCDYDSGFLMYDDDREFIVSTWNGSYLHEDFDRGKLPMKMHFRYGTSG